MAEAKKTSTKPQEPKFTIDFSKGSLDAIKHLAAYYHIPEDKLENIIFKGLRILSAVEQAKQDKVFIDEGREWKIIHLKE